MNETTYVARIAAIREGMKARGLDLLVAIGRGSIAQFGLLHYISGYTPVLRYGAVILPLDGEPILAVTTPSDIALAGAVTLVSDIRIAPFGEARGDQPNLAGLIRETLGRDAGTVGIAGMEDVLPAAEYLQWQRTMPGTQFVPATQVITQVKAIKTGAEIAAIEDVSALADEAFIRLHAALREPGCTLSRAAGVAEAYLREQGAHEILVYASRGPHFLHRPSMEVPLPGDLLTIFIEASDAGGHWVELARIIQVGELDVLPAGIAVASIAGMARAEAALTAGTTAGKVFSQVEAEIASRGGHSGLWYGHGVGVDHDLPVIGRDEATRIAPGMVIAMHPHIVDGSGRYGASLCETFVIDETGCRALSKLPRTPFGLS